MRRRWMCVFVVCLALCLLGGSSALAGCSHGTMDEYGYFYFYSGEETRSFTHYRYEGPTMCYYAYGRYFICPECGEEQLDADGYYNDHNWGNDGYCTQCLCDQDGNLKPGVETARVEIAASQVTPTPEPTATPEPAPEATEATCFHLSSDLPGTLVKSAGVYDSGSHFINEPALTDCPICNRTVPDIQSAAGVRLEAHRFGDDDRCVDCGFCQGQPLCQHYNSETRESDHWAESISPQEHEIYRKYLTVCWECGQTSVVVIQVENREPHSFDHSGRCTSCGFEETVATMPIPSFNLKLDGSLSLEWVSCPEATRYGVVLQAEQGGQVYTCEEKTVAVPENPSSTLLYLSVSREEAVTLAPELRQPWSVTATVNAYLADGTVQPYPATVAIPIRMTEAPCAHENTTPVDTVIEYDPYVHWVVEYVRCDACGETLRGQELAVDLHAPDKRGVCQYVNGENQCGYRGKLDYEDMLRSLVDGQNPLDHFGIRTYLREALLESPLDEENVDEILWILHDAPALYRDLYVYSFDRYNIDKDGNFLFLGAMNAFSGDLNKLYLGTDRGAAMATAFFHESGHAIDASVIRGEWGIGSSPYSTGNDDRLFDLLVGDVKTFLQGNIRVLLANRAAQVSDWDDLTMAQRTSYLFGEDLSSHFAPNLDAEALLDTLAADLADYMTKYGIKIGKSWMPQWLRQLHESNNGAFVRDYLQPCTGVVTNRSGIGSFNNAFMAADIVGAVTNDYVIPSGHPGSGYWYSMDDSKGSHGWEAWAEFYAAQVMRNEGAILSNYATFPQTCKYFETLANTMLDILKDELE